MPPGTPSQTPQARLPYTLALVITLAMAVAYTVLDTI